MAVSRGNKHYMHLAVIVRLWLQIPNHADVMRP